MKNVHVFLKLSSRRFKVGKGTMIVIDARKAEAEKKKELERFEDETMFSTFGACPNHPEIVFESLEPRMFSFNSPFGACPTCHGLGEITEISEDKVIPDKNLSIMDGALAVYGSMDLSWRAQQLAMVGKKHGFDVFTPIKDFTEQQLHVLLYGDREPVNGQWSNGATMWMRDGWEGVIPQTMRLYRQTESEWRKEDIEKFMTSSPATRAKAKNCSQLCLL